MSNILQTESLIKSQNFLAESLKVLWAHKNVFFAFAIGPIFLFTTLTYIEAVYNIPIEAGGSLFIHILFDLAWLRYILHEGPTKSSALHWRVNTNYLRFSLYYFLIFLPYIAFIVLLYYMCQLPMEDPTLALDPQFTINILMFILVVCVVSYFILPAFLALSAIAINQPINIFKTLQKASPYRTSLFLSCAMLLLITTAPLIFIFAALHLNPSIHFVISSFLMNLWAFFSVGLFFNLFSLYYKKYLAHAHEING